ncbi:MAG: DUF502 domain-containing protein [Planctomycetes bacterium]|nr:DUF502 domain-containing protein [Planctomycetota bacterium]
MAKPLKELGKKLLRYFLAGAFAVLPVVVTVAIVIWVTNLLQRFVGPSTYVGSALRHLGLKFPVDPNDRTLAYIVGWFCVLAFVFLLGVAVETGAKRLITVLTDTVLKRVPVVGSIYNTSKQLVSMLDTQDKADLKGMSVVYCTFGQEKGVGLLALLVSPDVFPIGGENFNVVIVPTAPVPFGGAMLFVPTRNVHPAPMSVDGLMSIYVSMGITAPQFMATTPVLPAGGTAASRD